MIDQFNDFFANIGNFFANIVLTFRQFLFRYLSHKVDDKLFLQNNDPSALWGSEENGVIKRNDLRTFAYK